MATGFKVVVLAGSAGALPVILAQLDRLTGRSDAALFVIYHRLANPDFVLEAFAPACVPVVRAARPGLPVAPGAVYYPHDDQDLQVRGGQLLVTAPSARNHPNIDLLLGSLAREYGPRVLAVLLSGMAKDGLRGLEAVRKAGGRIVVQDPEGCRFPQLPRAAIDAGLGDEVLGLREINAVVEQTLGLQPPQTP